MALAYSDVSIYKKWLKNVKISHACRLSSGAGKKRPAEAGQGQPFTDERRVGENQG
jgi:hypothetical protein